MINYKIINSYPNYEVSKKGIVRNAIHKNTLKPMKTIHGYLRVGLYNEEGMKKIQIHRIVAEAFIPNPENKPFVNHKDGNKLNNNDWNLEWCDGFENMRHCDLLGLRKMPKGINHHKSKLSDKDVLSIKNDISKTSFIAKKYKVSFTTIWNIKNNKTYKN